MNGKHGFFYRWTLSPISIVNASGLSLIYVRSSYILLKRVKSDLMTVLNRLTDTENTTPESLNKCLDKDVKYENGHTFTLVCRHWVQVWNGLKC
jgi:hypothetical protein